MYVKIIYNKNDFVTHHKKLVDLNLNQDLRLKTTALRTIKNNVINMFLRRTIEYQNHLSLLFPI